MSVPLFPGIDDGVYLFGVKNNTACDFQWSVSIAFLFGVFAVYICNTVFGNYYLCHTVTKSD